MRLRLQAGSATALGVGFFVYLLLFSNVLAPLNRFTTDFLYRPTQVLPNIAIVAIDKKSIDELGDGPVARSVHAALLERLQSGPATTHSI